MVFPVPPQAESLWDRTIKATVQAATRVQWTEQER